MNSKVNSKVNSTVPLKRWNDFDHQLMRVIQAIKVVRKNDSTYQPSHRDDWLDAMTYAMHFGTPDEIYRAQVHAAREAELEGRAFTPVFWTGEFGAEPILTLWRV